VSPPGQRRSAATRPVDPFRRFGLADRREEVVTCLLAAAAGFCAETAVLMVGGMPLTFLAAGAARRCAGFDRRAEEAEIGRCLAGEDATGGLAGVCAVEVETNAADQLLHVLLAETSVGAARAASGAGETLVDTTHEGVAIKAGRLGMRLDHFLNCHVLSLLVRAGAVEPKASLTRLRSPEPDGVAALNHAALDYVGIDAHIRVIVLRCRT
jgi:hypothetical protein